MGHRIRQLSVRLSIATFACALFVPMIVLPLAPHVALAAKYNWPLVPHTSAHLITSVLDEHRDNNRFHRGADITGPEGTNVWALRAGWVVGVLGGTVLVQVTNTKTATGYDIYSYNHLNDIVVNNNQQITAGDVPLKLGIIDGASHVHFEQGRGTTTTCSTRAIR